MSKLTLLGVSVVTGVVAASAFATPATAWHPAGQIKKSVQNVTKNSQLVDANDANSGLTVSTGDILKYVIEVSNTGKANANGYNDMHKTVMTDSLPEGIELVSNAKKREIREDLGVIKPGQKVTKEYQVRVTADKDKTVILNEACFTGDSEVNDAPQAGCDDAYVSLTVPQTTPEQPKEEPKGTGGAETPAKEEEEVVTTLPETGIPSLAGIFAGISGFGYAAHRLVSRKRK